MEEGQLDEGESFGSSQKVFGYREMVLMQVQKVITNANRQMKEGLIIMSNNPNINEQPKGYVVDTRIELMQSIDMLYDLILPEFDDEMTKTTDAIYNKLKPVVQDSKYHQQCVNDALERIYVENPRRYIEGEWNFRMLVYRELRQALLKFLNRKGWLQAGEINL